MPGTPVLDKTYGRQLQRRRSMEEVVMTNGMDPGRMNAPERLDEVSTLLAMAMMRVWLRRRKERSFSRDSARDSLELPSKSRLTVTAGHTKG